MGSVNNYVYDQLYPHSPFVKERETVDNGFSRGWGFHFQPSEEYWVDCHNHMGSVKTVNEVLRMIDQWFSRLDAFRLGKSLFISDDFSSFEVLKSAAEVDDRFAWLVHIPFDKPDIEVFKKALDNRAVGLKLHNAPIMKGEGDPECWFKDEWAEIFRLAESSGVPVLWHVTQRVSYSPYHGGGENAYWSEGHKKGVTFTNEDLLAIFLKILEMYPKLKVIGAHQLHIGLERLSTLLDRYQNLYIDTSCGFYLRWADTLYEEDRRILWEFFMKYRDRILFGTDSGVAPDKIDEYLVQGFLCHARFINQLRLPYDVLQLVSHKNAETVFGLSPVSSARRGNVRP